MSRWTARALLVCLALPGPTRAEDLLSWAACLETARRHNPDWAATQETLQERRNARRESLNALGPTLSLYNSYNDSDRPSPQTRWQAGGTAQWDLWNQQKIAALRSADAALEQARADRALQSAQTRRALRSAFGALLAAQELTATAETIRALRQKNARTVALKYEAGREFKGNKMKAEAEWAQAEVARTQALRDLRAAQVELARQLGASALPVLEPTDLPKGPPGSFPADSPRRRSAAARRRAAEAALQSARSDFWPSLTSSYTRGFSGPREFPTDPQWSAGLTLRVPLFSGGPTAAWDRARGARHALARAREEERATDLDLRAQWESAEAEWASAQDQKHVRALFLNAARQRNNEATVRYTQGMISFDIWEQAVAELVQSEQNHIAARRNAWAALGQWEEVQGMGLEAP